MAIVKVGTYRNPPEDITDYEAIVAHLEAYTRQIGNQGMILTEWTNTTNAPKIAMGSYISHGGVLYVVEDEDYSLPSLSSDGTYYIRVAVSGDTLALDYITDLTGYVWNAIYNGLYHPDGKQVLPYQLVKAGAVLTKRKITNLMQGSGFVTVDYLGAITGSGPIVATSLDTGHGAMTFNQGVKTTDSPTFNTIGFTSLNPNNSVETSIQLSAGNSYLLPKGAYAIKIETTSVSVACEMYHGSSWITIFGGTGGFVISDGVNFRLSHNGGSGTFNIIIRKW
jgi:hypothetical protein